MNRPLNVKVTLTPQQIDGRDRPVGDPDRMGVEAHGDRPDLVVLAIGAKNFAFDIRELERAIRACSQ